MNQKANILIYQNGGDAMNAYATLHVKSLDEQNVVRAQLLKYCELDTLAMVKVLGKLKKECCFDR